MQTFLYVLGPFLLQAGFGLAAVILAIGFVAKVLVPKAKIMQHDLKKIMLTDQYAKEAHGFICDLVVEWDRNQIFEDATPPRLFKSGQELNREILDRKALDR